MANFTDGMKEAAFATSPREFDLSYSTTLEILFSFSLFTLNYNFYFSYYFLFVTFPAKCPVCAFSLYI